MTSTALDATRPSSGSPATPTTDGRGVWRRYRWILGRLGSGLLTLLLVSMLIFTVTTLLPGDAAQAILGHAATPQALEALRAKLGLNQPPVVQYLHWIGGAIHGDFGTSLVSHTSVVEAMAPRIANTLTLLVITALIGFPLAVALGVSAAVRPGGVWDGVVNLSSVILAALPEFVIGIILILAFATGALQLFPAVSLTPEGTAPLSDPIVLVLPVATLVIAVLPYLSRQIRSSLIESLGSEYVVMAELKGLPQRVVLLRHALRNALTPGIQAGALTLAYLLGGTIVVEYLFQYPGIGFALTNAVSQRDVPVVQFIVLVLALGYVLFNLAADILTVYVTPKLRTR